MGHFVRGFIVLHHHALQVSATEPRLRGVSLAQDFVLFPLTDDLIDELFPPPHAPGYEDFTYLCGPLVDLMKFLSAAGPIVYFETVYHGGTGGQSAVVFEDGRVKIAPLRGEFGPINEALRAVGAVAGRDTDEFDAVGLSRHRYSEDWLDEGRKRG